MAVDAGAVVGETDALPGQVEKIDTTYVDFLSLNAMVVSPDKR